MNIFEDSRTVLTLDAGGTNMVFGAMKGGKPTSFSVTLPSNAHDLDLCLNTMVEGFNRVIETLSEKPLAISFAFPGPADYPNGIIGGFLPNFPSFRDGVALGPFLQKKFHLQNLMNQLRFYNGCIPLKKEPVIEKLHEIVNAINFLAENDVQNGKQFENLKGKLIQTSEEAYTTLKQLDFKIGEMTNIAKLILLAQENRNGYSDEIKRQLIELNIDSNISYSEIIDRIEISKKSRDFLYSEFKKIQKDIQKYNKIEYVSTQIEKDKKIQK